jgi:hypothetical protein
MKKSEIIKTIVYKLKRCHDRHGNLSFTFEEVAKEILNDIQEAGMLAPEYFAEPPHIVRGKKHLGNYVNEWEPEEDEK